MGQPAVDMFTVFDPSLALVATLPDCFLDFWEFPVFQ